MSGNSPETPSKNAKKICSVCGDKALGYNFNALSCESCKAFFRRNAIKDKGFKCPFNDNCEITLITRRFCQKCRLKKCFNVGMNKDLILSDAEKQQKKQQISHNRAKKRLNSVVNSPNPTLSSTTTSSDIMAASVLVDLHPSVDSIKKLPIKSEKEDSESAPKVCKIEAPDSTIVGMKPIAGPSPLIKQELFNNSSVRMNTINSTITSSMTDDSKIEQQTKPHSFLTGTMEQKISAAKSDLIKQFVSNQEDPNQRVIPDFSKSHCLEDIIKVAVEAEFHVTDSINNDKNSSKNSRTLNDEEQGKIDELFVASRALVEPLELEKSRFEGLPKNIISVINLTELAIKRIIRMAKEITPFTKMCINDQIALLKGGCTDIMILRSAINYNPDKNTWRLPTRNQTEFSLDLLKEASIYGVNLYEEHEKFIKSFDPRWRSDENVMLILSAIALFTYSRPNVVHPVAVKLEQDSYYHLLRRYLEIVCKHGCEASEAFLHLIERLKGLNNLNEIHMRIFQEVNPQLVEPLLIEVFDL